MARLSKLFSFRQWQATRPNSPLPGQDVDSEFAEHRRVINEIDDELKDIRRADGALNNGIVTQDSLAPGLLSKLTDPITQAVANARTSGAAAAHESKVNADVAVQASIKAQESEFRTLQAEAQVLGAAPGALQTIQDAQAKATQAALDATNAAAGISNAEKSAAADADLAHKYAELSELWAEWMGQDGRHDQTLPPNKLKEMGITGDHWSARWWANKAANAFGQLTGLYLGVHPDHGSATASAGGPLTTGAIYYNSTTQTAYIWDGNGWKEFLKPSRAFTATLTYDATASQSVFDITTPDKFSRTSTRTSTEAVDVFLNGVRLVPTDDYSVVGNVVTLNQAAPLHSMVQIDVYRDPNSLAPGAMNARLIRGITPDGVQTVFVATRQDTGQPIAAASPAELLVSVDGVIQEPGVDYQVNVKDVQFTKAPSTDSVVFMVWYEPASAAGATRVIPAGTRLDALLDVSASGGKAPRPDDALLWDDTDKRWEPKPFNKSLADLNDTSLSAALELPKDKEVLTWDDTKKRWISQPSQGGKSRLDELLDVDAKNTHVPRDKDVLTYDQTAKKWSPSKALPDATVKALASDADPDASKLPAGYLVLTTENNKHRLSVVSATGTLITLFDDVDLNQRIAANSLFQGAVKTPGELTALPTPATTNRGFYWTWQGSSGFVIAGSGATGSIVDPTIGLSTVTLNTGDWLQSDGTKWVHVSADLLSKQRWMTLGGFVPWAASTYEQGALVVHRASAGAPLHYYRATGAVIATDGAPGTTGAPWEDITPQASILGASDFDATVPPSTGDVVKWDGASFVAAPEKALLEHLDDVEDGLNPTDGDVLYYDGIEWTTASLAMSSLSDVQAAGVVDGQVLVWNTDHWEPGTTASSISALTDVDLTTRAQADGDALVWDATSGKWVPQVPSTSHPFLGSLTARPTAANVGDTYYQTAAQTITTTTPGTTPAGIVAPTPTYDPLMNTPLQAGAVPDPASPGNPWRNPAVVPLPSTEPKYRFIYNGVTYQVDGAAPLIARINAGQATPDLWAQGANPPISVSTGTPGTTTTTNVGVGFYRWDGANWIRVASNLGDLPDVDLTTVAQANGDALVWDATASKWKPKKITSPIIYLGTGAWVAADVNDAAKRYGMAADTVPSPADYAPIAGDQYIDISTGQITTFTGAAPTAGTIRTVSGITGGNSPPTFDMAKDLLIDLRDVDLKTTAPVASDVLTYDGAKWIALAPAGYSQAEIDTKLDSLVIGLSHETAVIAITNDPPTNPVDDEFYIVGVSPTGDFVGHATHIAYHIGGVWRFQAPVKGETRLVETAGTDGENWHFNGSIWVKVANASAAAPKVASMSMVGDIKQSWLSETEFNGILVAAGETGKWVLADGRDVTGSDFAKVTGLNNVPDLRGAYLRIAGQNNNHLTAWDGGTHRGYMNHATARPATAFTGTTSDPGTHTHSQYHATQHSGGGGGDMHAGGYGDQQTGPAGAHTHTVTINGGGDAETRPSTFSVNTFIKVNN